MLEIKGLTVEFGKNRVLDEISLTVDKGKVLGIVGESGSGKTMTALSVMGLLSGRVTKKEGSIKLDGLEVMNLKEKELEKIRGSKVAMIFQEPMTSLNPTMKIGRQLDEVLILHENKKDKERVLKALDEAGLSDGERVYDCYPHELSGGMRQRVMIAMALLGHPDYLLCDEPTTALDVTTEKGIIALIDRIRKEHDMGVVFITHDLKLLNGFADEVAVMQSGHVVETGTCEDIFKNPSQEYTKRLINAIPNRGSRRHERNLSSDEKILKVEALNGYYKDGKKNRQVLFDVSLEVKKGEILGIVGESGCGKSSLAKVILGINRMYDGNISHYSERPQMVFQDPFSSLNPAWTIERILEEPLKLKGIKDKEQRKEKVTDMLVKVGLTPEYLKRRPSDLSGGQRQRISIGAALIGEPALVVADEPLSALDVTIQAQVMELMLRLQKEMGLTYIFISHDIDVVYQMCDRIAVMRAGRIVECGKTQELFDNPKEEYTRSLWA